MAAQGNDRKSIRRAILDLAWPVVAANLLQVLATTVDLIMVGRLGEDAIAAVGIGGNLTFFTFVILIGVSSGTIALVSRAIGAKDRKEADHFLGQSILAGALLSLPIVLVGLLIPHLIVRPFSTGPAVESLASSYVSVIYLVMPSLATIFISTAALRAAGDAKTPLFIGAAENVINFVLNYGLIFGNFGLPALGVQGAAIGTSITFTIGALAYLVLFARGRLRLSIRREKPFVNRESLRRIFRVGVPAMGEQIAFQSGLLVWMIFVVSFGTPALAAHQIGLRVQSFAFMPGIGFSIAAAALVGQNLGAKDLERAELSGREATKMSVLVMSAIAAVNFTFAPYIALAFTEPGEALDLSVLFIRLHALSIPAVGLYFTFAGALRGAGDTRWPFYAVTVGTYAIRLPLSILLGFGLGLGIFGIWVALPIEYYIRSAIIVPRFTGGKWKAMKV